MAPTASTRDRMTVLAPEGMLGYGIPVRSMEEGLPYAVIPSSALAVPPSIATLSASLRPGVSRM